MPMALQRIKKVVTAFVGTLGIPFCAKRPIEDELSRSITMALIDSSQSIVSERTPQQSLHDISNQNKSDILNNLDLSSITANLRDSSFISMD